MRVLILRDRRFTPPGLHRMSVHYTPGLQCTVRRSWGALLVAAGDAVEIEPPSRDQRKA